MRWLTGMVLSLGLASGWARAGPLPIRVYTTEQGLAHDHVNRLYLDSRGFLWICTDEGLSRFDGNHFVNYTVAGGLPHIHVNDMLETRSGGYWFATDGGVTRFDPHGQPKRFVTYAPGGPPEALRVNSLAEESDQSILLGTSAGLYRLRLNTAPATFEHIPVDFPNGIPEAATVNALKIDRESVLWVASVSGVYRRGKDGTWNRFVVGESPHVFINSIAEDPGGRIWICTRQHGFGRFAGADGQRAILDSQLDLKSGLPDNDVRSLLFGSDGRRWAATSSGLVDWSDPARLGVLATRNGLSDDSIYALAEDPAGSLWIGTRRGGVMRMGRQDWKTFDRSDGLLPGHDGALLQTSGDEICVADLSDTRRPMRCLQGDHFSEFIPPLPPGVSREPPNSSETAMQDHLGAWWISTGQGAFYFPGAGRARDLTRSRYLQVSPGAQTTRLFEDARGDVWIATVLGERNGLLHWDRASGTVHDETPALAAQSATVRVSALAEVPAGQLWMGLGHGGGLFRSRNGRFEAVKNPLGGRISTLFVDHSHRLWIGSLEGGLGRIDDPAAGAPNLQVFTAAQGLSSNEIWCVAEDNFGRIYAGNARGVDRIDPKTGEVLHYAQADGLVTGDIRSALRDRNGDLWFLSNRGLSRLHPSIDLHPPAAQVRITGLRVAGTPWPVSDLGETELGPLEFSSRQNSLTLEFGAIDYGLPSNLMYQYRLEGSAGDWSVPNGSSSVTFANLSPGRYRFTVRTGSPAARNGRTARLQFTILPPVWMRWWFLAGLGIGLTAFAYALHRIQLERKLAPERVRSRIAMDLHDDLGASLARMAVIGEVLKNNVVQRDLDSQLMLNDVAETSRRLVEGMNDIVWSIDPRHQQLSDIVDRLREFASGILEPKGIRWQFDVPADILRVTLSTEQRRQLYLVCKEAIHNIARHSKASNAYFTLAVERGAVCAKIEDDGCGIRDDDGHGLGLRSMRMRAKELGGSLEIRPASKQGTLITLRFRLKGGRA